MNDVIIIVKGGLVQEVYATNTNDIAVTLVDLDNLESEEKLTISRGNYFAWNMGKSDWKNIVKLVVDEKDLILLEE